MCSQSSLIAAILLVAALAAGSHSFAQDRVRTLQISEGSVVIDGNPVPQAQLPANFNPAGTVLSLQFSESSRAIFELNGSYFTVEGRRIVPFERARFVGALPSAVLLGDPAVDDVRVMRQRLATIEAERARATGQELQQLAREREQLVKNMNEVVQQASRVAYVHSIQSQNRALYQRMEREARMEVEAQALAQRVSTLPAGEDRTALVAELRDKLSEIFEIKQQNRRDEIAELTDRLGELRSRLNERERHKKEIIERRMDELLGRPSHHDW